MKHICEFMDNFERIPSLSAEMIAMSGVFRLVGLNKDRLLMYFEEGDCAGVKVDEKYFDVGDAENGPKLDSCMVTSVLFASRSDDYVYRALWLLCGFEWDEERAEWVQAEPFMYDGEWGPDPMGEWHGRNY